MHLVRAVYVCIDLQWDASLHCGQQWSVPAWHRVDGCLFDVMRIPMIFDVVNN